MVKSCKLGRDAKPTVKHQRVKKSRTKTADYQNHWRPIFFWLAIA